MVTPDEFDAAFDRFRVSAFRLECRQSYAVGEEDARLRAFRDGTARPERSIRTDPWLRRIAATTLAGKSWCRVRLVTYPLTDYTRYQLIGYVESHAVGDDIRIWDVTADPEMTTLGPDFWLFDADELDAFVIRIHYTDQGIVHSYSFGEVEPAVVRRDLALARSIPLAEFLARQECR